MKTEIESVPACPPRQVMTTRQGQLSFCCGGEGEVVIFLHGLLGSANAWAFQFAGLASFFHIAAWDAPGYGESTPVTADIDAYVQVLHEFIGRYREQPVTLVGHSMGGTVASRYTALHPEKVRRLVLSCTHPGYGESASAPASAKLEARLRELNEIGPEAYGRNRARDLLPFPDIPPAVLSHAARIAAGTSPEGLRLASRMLQLADNRPLLPTITRPTLVLTGEKDPVVQPRLQAELLALVPFTRHIVMPGLGHAPYFQNPDYYNSLLRDFIAHDGRV